MSGAITMPPNINNSSASPAGSGWLATILRPVRTFIDKLIIRGASSKAPLDDLHRPMPEEIKKFDTTIQSKNSYQKKIKRGQYENIFERIKISILEPKELKHPNKVLVYFFGRSTNTKDAIDLLEATAKKGYRVVSYTPCGMNKGSMVNPSTQTLINDAKSVIEYIAKEYSDKESTFIAHSLGTLILPNALDTLDKEVKDKFPRYNLKLISPATNFAKIKEHLRDRALGFLNNLSPIKKIANRLADSITAEPLDAINPLKKVLEEKPGTKVDCIALEKDRVIPKNLTLDLFKEIAGKYKAQFKTVLDMGHNIEKNFDRLFSALAI